MYSYTQGFETLLKHTNEKHVFEVKLGKYIENHHVQSLLDIGAGDGSLAANLAKKVKTYVAVESKEKYVAQLRAAALETIQGEFPLSVPGTYDLVLMSHVISYNLGNHNTLVSPAWELVKPGGHLLVITHGNNQDDDWGKLLAHIGFGEPEKFAITFDDIVETMAAHGTVEIQKIETTVETQDVNDLIAALNFVASGNNVGRSERFMRKSATVAQYLTDNYRNETGFSFPFQHLFISAQR